MTKIIAANWKMNKTNAEAEQFFADLEPLVEEDRNRIIICAPFTALATVVRKCKKLKITPAAQNVHPAVRGTYTGEISASMLAEAGAKAVLAGHSERRAQFKESDDFINQKVKAALAAGLTAILCVGETIEEREAQKTFKVLKKQITAGLKDVTDAKNIIVAYEPVWAISGGDPSKPKPIATSLQIFEAHDFIKKLLAKQFAGVSVPVLYGGSANDKNCAEIFALQGVDGALVGGASLVPEKFAVLVNTVPNN